ncbi:MAG: hypothetical protein P8N02_13955, partial [Actinomycetota bacterium]|nr:hypothetical protein [Actinomycetota bacterium]
MDPQDTTFPEPVRAEANRAHGNHAHKVYPQQFDRNDFWSQIKRTVNGEPVSEEDIGMIVDQVTGQLQLASADHLLDLGCGNAALAARMFDCIALYTG